MSEAVPSRPTGMNSSVYRGLYDDGRSQATDAGKLLGRDAEPAYQRPAASPASAATVISLSAAAWDELKTTQGSAFDGTSGSISLPARESASSGVAHLSDQEIELRMLNAHIRSADAMLGARDIMAQHLDEARASYDKMLNTPPRAAVPLGAGEIAEVVKKAMALGYNPLGGKDNYMFGWEGKVYTFMADGSATVHEEGVATSVQQQQEALKASRLMIDRAANPMTDVTTERDALVARREAILGKAIERIA